MKRLFIIFAVLLMPFGAWGAFNQGTGGGGGSVDISDVTGLGANVLSPLETQLGTVGGFPTISSMTNGNCVQWGTNGTLLDAGAACGSGGGGSGTVSAGTTGELAQYAANGTTVSGLSLGLGVLAAMQQTLGSSSGFAATTFLNPVTAFNASGLITTGMGAVSLSTPTTYTSGLVLNGLFNGAHISLTGVGAAGATLNTSLSSGQGTTALIFANAASTANAAVTINQTGSIPAVSHTLTLGTVAGWSVGQGIDVATVGASGADLITSVTAINTGANTLTTAAPSVGAGTNVTVTHDDTAAIQAALSTCQNVQLPLGGYNVTSELEVACPQWLQGSGAVALNQGAYGSTTKFAGGSILWNRGTTNNVINVTAGQANIHDIGVQQALDKTPTAGYCFQVGNGGSGSQLENDWIQRNYCFNTFSMLHVNQGMDEAHITDNAFWGFTDTEGPIVTYNDPVPYGDNSITNNEFLAQVNPTDCLDFVAADVSMWTHNTFGGCDIAIKANSTTANSQTFVNNSFETFGPDPGIQLSAGDEWDFVGNQGDALQGACLFSLTGTVDHVTIMGTNVGFIQSGLTVCTPTTTGTFLTIAGNTQGVNQPANNGDDYNQFLNQIYVASEGTGNTAGLFVGPGAIGLLGTNLDSLFVGGDGGASSLSFNGTVDAAGGFTDLLVGGAGVGPNNQVGLSLNEFGTIMWSDDATSALSGTMDTALWRVGPGDLVIGANIGDTSGTLILTDVSIIRVLIANLPACAGAGSLHASVSNGIAAPTYHQAVGSTTGAATQPVFCNNVAWIYD